MGSPTFIAFVDFVSWGALGFCMCGAVGFLWASRNWRLVTRKAWAAAYEIGVEHGLEQRRIRGADVARAVESALRRGGQ